jgi:hypothetical protein
VNDILSRVKNINGKTNLIPQIQDKLNNLADDSAVMDLFRQLDPAVVSKVMGLAAGGPRTRSTISSPSARASTSS